MTKSVNCLYSLKILNRLKFLIVSSEKIRLPTFSNELKLFKKFYSDRSKNLRSGRVLDQLKSQTSHFDSGSSDVQPTLDELWSLLLTERNFVKVR